MKRLTGIAIAACLSMQPAVATAQATGGPGDYAALLAEALRPIREPDRAEWAYTETELTSDGVFVGRFDPRRPRGERWTLISVNGREPAAAEIEAYRDDKKRDDGWFEDDDGGLLEMVEDRPLELVEETGDYVLLRFVPDEEDLEDGFGEYVDSTLRIAKDGPWLEFINLQATEPFSPRFGVRVRDFLTRLVFQRLPDEGVVVPRTLEVRFSLRAFLVINIDEQVLRRYGDYERVTGERGQ